jgi:hypothetical protein
VALGELDQLEPARERRVREHGHAEVHTASLPPCRGRDQRQSGLVLAD